jgi:soluble P-type ATPase
VGLEHVQAPIDKIREMVKVYMASKDLYEGKLAGLDSETFRQVRSDVYQVLKRVYKR